jgi:Cu/Ag efflux pump CusA
MLNSIVSWALNMRVLVVAAALALLVIGINATKNAPLDVFPEFAPPLVEVQTEAPGLSTEEVDSLVTVPLENSLNGLPFLKTIRSKSVLGLSSVVMIFNTGTDILKARQLVQERLNLAQNRLPAVVKPPVLMAPYSSLSRVLKVGLRSETLSQMQLSELAVWTMRPRLMAVSGVANVAIWGQRDRQFQVLVDPQRLRAAGVTLDAITRAAGDAAVISAGGFIDTPNLRLPVNQLSLITTADDLARTVVEFRNGAPIRLGDVAEVVEGNPPLIGDAVINDGDGILLIVEKQPWGNTLDVTTGVEKVARRHAARAARRESWTAPSSAPPPSSSSRLIISPRRCGSAACSSSSCSRFSSATGAPPSSASPPSRSPSPVALLLLAGAARRSTP